MGVSVISREEKPAATNPALGHRDSSGELVSRDKKGRPVKFDKRGKAHRLSKKGKMKMRHKPGKILVAVLAFLAVFYCVFAFTDCPGLSALRNMWIQTAMTTAAHQWLATWFFPPWVIDKAMVGVNQPLGYQSDPNVVFDTSATNKTDAMWQEILGVAPSVPTPVDDVNGDQVLTADYAQGIIIVQIKSALYTGRLMFVDDPARVKIATAAHLGSYGEHILDYLSEHNAIAGTNANGFHDPGGEGNGGGLGGWCMSGGKLIGKSDGRDSGGFTNGNVLVVGDIKDPVKEGIRDMTQWGPAMVVDGKVPEADAGYGIQPRTAIGQLRSGVVVMATVDGRQPGHSIGISVADLAKVMIKYGALNAVLCDGGSSSIMGYNGKLVGIPSTPAKTTGRRLPDAWIVTRK
ncbi:MAG: phosphodiester glycosidase family protein [Coriobacteriales bacterium]|jgi:exopolysaccharide biosynthesis protein|nr:phosphodiester glycosidase family protein [Coriobacteriales bacterium]